MTPMAQAPSGQYAWSAPQAQYQHQQDDDYGRSQYGFGKSIQREVSYSIKRKGTEDLYKFDGQIEKFEHWTRKMADHLAESTQRYRTMIARISEQEGPILREGLLMTEIDGYNAWEIAVELESFTIKWLSEDLYEQRIRLCGNEEYNGMELWRNLFVNYSGNNKVVVNVSGLQQFMKFPRCENESDLLRHISDWNTTLIKYGGALRDDPTTLRALFLTTLPKTWEAKLKPKLAKYPTWQALSQYAKDKLEQYRELEISHAVHKKTRSSSSGRRGFVNALGHAQDDDESQPAASTSETSAFQTPSLQDLADMINAMGAGAGRKPTPSPKAKARTGPGAARKFPRFFFKGCWECATDGHSRAECPKWKKLLSENGGKPPKGHKGAKDRAYLEWKDKKKSTKKDHKVNALTEDDTEENDWEDSDADDDDPGRVFSLVTSGTPWRRAARTPPQNEVPQSRRFDLLHDDDDDDDEPVENDYSFLDTIAHRIQIGKKLTQSQRKKATRPTSDMGRICQLMKPLPKCPKKLEKLFKLCPTDEEPLKDGEIWVLADTGSTIHGINVKKEIPEYQHLVKRIPKNKQGRGAECANGGRVKIGGDITLKGHIDNDLHTIPFKDMEISMPIASMPQTVANGNDLLISIDGASITNRETGRKVKLHERQGVYFFKMSLLPPSQQPFHRPA